MKLKLVKSNTDGLWYIRRVNYFNLLEGFILKKRVKPEWNVYNMSGEVWFTLDKEPTKNILKAFKLKMIQ